MRLRMISEDDPPPEPVRFREPVRLWSGGVLYQVEYWEVESGRYDYRLLDGSDHEVGRCRTEGGVKDWKRSARRLLKSLHKSGDLKPVYDRRPPHFVESATEEAD